jgi:hypothetical protein
VPAALPAYAIAILMTAGPDDGCPSPRQLADALSAHMPGMVLPLGHATGSTTLRLAVTTDAAGAMRVDLSDPEGGPLLHRWLPASEHSRGGDCPALAETAALIVERYWHEVGFDVAIETPQPAPKPTPKATSPPPPPKPAEPPPKAAEPMPPPPKPPEPPPKAAEERPTVVARRAPESPTVPLPPPRWQIGLGAGGLLPETGGRAGWATLAIAIERPAFSRRVGLRLSAGAQTGVSVTFPTGSADILQIPVRMGAYLPIELGFGRLEPGIGLNLDVVAVDFTRKTSTAATSETHLGASPGIDAALAWALLLPHAVYVRALAEGVTSVPYHVVTASNDMRIFDTPRFALRFGIELGVWFP